MADCVRTILAGWLRSRPDHAERIAQDTPGDPTASPSQPATLATGTRWAYEQECDLGSTPQRVTITIDSQGAGGYVVLRTSRWAMDCEADVAQLVRWLREALEAAKGVER